MASTEGENHEISGRRTRSGRRLSAQAAASPTPARSTRRTRKQTQEQLTEQEIIEAISESVEQHQSPHMKDTSVEESQCEIIEISEVRGQRSTDYAQANDADPVDHHHQEAIIIDDDVEMFVSQEDEPIITEVPISSDGAIDEKSSSFPFGTNVGQSETSDDVPNEEDTPVESSLLASLAGDNANSLPSVGDESKRDDFEAKIHSDKLDSDDSMSEPAIAEDLDGMPADNSDATIVNTEIISEDELPMPTKPEINDAEEVSDEELPAPARAELPADAEVISEDELPAAALNDKSIEQNKSEDDGKQQKRKASDMDNDKKKEAKTDENAKENDEGEQYNPMSPTSESNEGPPSMKKAKIEEASIGQGNEQKDRNKDKDKQKDRDKDHKEKDNDNSEKERKKLPDLDKYWRTVKDDPADFTGWTNLLQYVDNETDAEAAREAYDAFLAQYPYCYGYWRKYADYEKRKGIKANCNAVFERGLEAIPLSVDLWIHYLAHVKLNHEDDETYIRSQFERAVNACGLEFRSDKLWDAFIKWEADEKRYHRVMSIYDRLLAIPTQGYSTHFDNFQDFVNQHSPVSFMSGEELKRIRAELRESSRGSSSSRSKSRRKSSSKERDGKEEKRDETNHDGAAVTASGSEIGDEANHHSQHSNDGVIEVEKEAATRHALQKDLCDLSTITDDELVAIKEKIISSRRRVHKQTVAAVTARWTFEEGIKRPYFHVKPLERCQLKNWKDYLDFEIEKGDRTRILVLFERCLIACALYDEFWLKMIRYLESQSAKDQPDIVAVTRDVYRRACDIHHPTKPSLHLMWAAFEECQNDFDRSAQILENLERKCPNLLQIAYRRINVERRRGDLSKCRSLYEHYIGTAKNKTIAGSLAIKYARFLNKICNDLDGGLRVLRQALDKDAGNTRVALQMVDLALQRATVNETEVVSIMEKFMARDSIDPEEKVLFAQRKVEFLEDFGSTAKGLQDAQRALQVALSKANEAKKKRESSPSRSKASTSKDSAAAGNSTAQAAYNNGGGSVAAGGSNYAYNSTNSAYYGQSGGGAGYAQPSYDGYYNQWQYGSGYSGYGQWSGYGNYY